MADLTANTTLNPVSGRGFVNVGTPDTGSELYLANPGTNIVSGDQLEYTDSPNTSVAADTTVTQTTAGTIAVRVWRAATETWGSWFNVEFIPANSLTTTSTLNPIDGNAHVNVVDPSTAEGSLFAQYSGSTPATGDQLEYTDSPNTSVAANGGITQTVTRNFQARLRRESTGVWDSFSTISLVSGGTTVGVTLRPELGTGFINVTNPSTDEGSIFFEHTGSVPLSGHQIEWTGEPNTSMESTGIFSQITRSNFNVRIWRSGSQTWSQVYTIEPIVPITGTASHQATTATHAATGARVITGVSNHQATAATHAATGLLAISGTAAHQAATATHAATGVREVTGTAAHQAATATHGSDGFVIEGEEIEGNANHQAARATHAASGTRVITGVASHQAATATHAATGNKLFTGAGAHQATTATHAATGTRVVTGVSNHQAAAATHAASGTRVVDGTASHQAAASTHAATGTRVITGTAAHQAATATHNAGGGVVVIGTASHQAATATHSASGARVVTGIGTHQAAGATHAATGVREITGTGAHQARRATHAAESGAVTANIRFAVKRIVGKNMVGRKIRPRGVAYTLLRF